MAMQPPPPNSPDHLEIRVLYTIYACLVVVSGLFLMSNSGSGHSSSSGSSRSTSGSGSSYSSGGGWSHK